MRPNWLAARCLRKLLDKPSARSRKKHKFLKTYTHTSSKPEALCIGSKVIGLPLIALHLRDKTTKTLEMCVQISIHLFIVLVGRKRFALQKQQLALQMLGKVATTRLAIDKSCEGVIYKGS